MNKSLEIMKKYQPISMVRVVTDLNKSFGNYLVDVDGKKYLDLHCNISSLALGYNHPQIVNKIKTKPHLMVQRPATSLYPSKEHISHLENVYPKLNPFIGDDYYLWLGQGGTEAVEAAMRIAYRYKFREEFGYDDCDLNSEKILNHQDDWIRDKKMISFRGGYHGRTMGSLSLTRTSANHKVGIPHLNFIMTDFSSNTETDRECLDQLQKILVDNRNDITGLITEPIQSEGGHNECTPEFFQGVRDLCLEHRVPFIADCVQTALGTGNKWGFEHLLSRETPPDIVVGSKKTQLPIVYSQPYLRIQDIDAYSMNSTWSGCPLRGTILGVTLDVIEQNNLLEKSRDVGQFLVTSLECFSHYGLTNIRGYQTGTFIAFDIPNRDDVIRKLQENNVIVGPAGTNSIRLRPTLTLEKEHVEQFLLILEKVLSTI